MADVEAAVARLTEEEKSGALILTPSYGHAGALELMGSGSLPVVSPHNTYYLWGLPDQEISTIVSIGYQDPLEQMFDEVEQVGTVRCTYCTGWRNNLPIFIARHPGPVRLGDVWNRFKHFE